MPAPAVPRPCFVVIQTEFIFGGLEAFLNTPAGSLDLDQGFNRCALGTPCREIGLIIVGGIAPDQQAARPQAGWGVIVFGGVEIGEFAISPVVKALSYTH